MAPLQREGGQPQTWVGGVGAGGPPLWPQPQHLARWPHKNTNVSRLWNTPPSPAFFPSETLLGKRSAGLGSAALTLLGSGVPSTLRGSCEDDTRKAVVYQMSGVRRDSSKNALLYRPHARCTLSAEVLHHELI